MLTRNRREASNAGRGDGEVREATRGRYREVCALGHVGERRGEAACWRGSGGVREGRREGKAVGREHAWGAGGAWWRDTEGRRGHAWLSRESEGRRESAGGHHVGGLLALCGVGGGNGVDDGLGLFLADLLVVVHHVSQVVSTGVMRLAYAHRVVCQVDITVVAEEFGHIAGFCSKYLAVVARKRKIPFRDGSRSETKILASRNCPDFQ